MKCPQVDLAAIANARRTEPACQKGDDGKHKRRHGRLGAKREVLVVDPRSKPKRDLEIENRGRPEGPGQRKAYAIVFLDQPDDGLQQVRYADRHNEREEDREEFE